MNAFRSFSPLNVPLKAAMGLGTLLVLSACGGGFRTNSTAPSSKPVAQTQTDSTITQSQPDGAKKTAPPAVSRGRRPVVIPGESPKAPDGPSPEAKKKEESEPVSAEKSPQAPPAPAPMPKDHTPAPAAPAPKADVTPDPSKTPDHQPSAGPVKPAEPSKEQAGKRSLSWEVFHSATMWMRMPHTRPWTQLAMTSIHAKIETLDRARDISLFCPGYTVSTQAYRELCWLRLVSAVVQYESKHNPESTFREPNGAVSVGLFSLSPNECGNAPRIVDLKDPLRNLACGIEIMTGLIGRDGYIDGPAGHRGAAAYWSVLRPPYSAYGYALGRKKEIMAITRSYQSF